MNAIVAPPLKLVYIIGTFPLITNTFINREIKGLRQRGVEVRVVSIRRPPAEEVLSAEQQELQPGVIYLLPLNVSSFILGNLYFALLHLPVYFKTLLYLLTRPHPHLKARLMTCIHFGEGVYAAYLLRSQTIDVLHAHFVDRAATVALVASRLLGVPYSLTAHANDIYVDPMLLPEKMAEAKFITTCTGYNQTYLWQMLDDQVNDKLHLVYHGLDLASYQPTLAQLRPDRPLLLAVGRLTEKKGFVYLIDACALLRDKGYEFYCHIVGGGSLQKALTDRITRLGLENVVTLCGVLSHEAVKDKYRQATLFVLPCVVAEDGDRDGIPNVLIEAMAMQLPVVSTRHSGIPELVEDKINGLLVPSKDEKVLAEALATLLDDPALCAQLGRHGRQKVVETFDLECNLQQLFDLFVVAATNHKARLSTDVRMKWKKCY